MSARINGMTMSYMYIPTLLSEWIPEMLKMACSCSRMLRPGSLGLLFLGSCTLIIKQDGENSGHKMTFLNGHFF